MVSGQKCIAMSDAALARLKILPHLEADVLGNAQILLARFAANNQPTGHRQIKGVVGCLECHDAHVRWQCILCKVNLWSIAAVSANRQHCWKPVTVNDKPEGA